MRKIKIMLVDDNRVQSTTMKHLLKSYDQNFDVVIAESGEVCLEELRRRECDFIISDYEMHPGMNGIELLKQVRTTFNSTPFVLLTGKEERELVKEAFKYGADEYFVKSDSAMIIRLLHYINQSFYNKMRLKWARYDTVRAIRALVRVYQPPLYRHCAQVKRIAGLLAKVLGCGEAERKTVKLASLFHDIGKVSIKHDILDKSSGLTPQEVEHIRQHTILGERIVRETRSLATVAPVVRHHHERYDGGGYPDGLKGEQIEPAARIISVADAFSAMTMTRSYNNTLSGEDALREISAHSGSQFDPLCAKTLRKCLSNNRIYFDKQQGHWHITS